MPRAARAICRRPSASSCWKPSVPVARGRARRTSKAAGSARPVAVFGRRSGSASRRHGRAGRRRVIPNGLARAAESLESVDGLPIGALSAGRSGGIGLGSRLLGRRFFGCGLARSRAFSAAAFSAASLSVARCSVRPFNRRLFDAPVLHFGRPAIHEPLALEAPVEERPLADVGLERGDALALAGDSLRRRDLRRARSRRACASAFQRVLDSDGRGRRRPGPEFEVSGRRDESKCV